MKNRKHYHNLIIITFLLPFIGALLFLYVYTSNLFNTNQTVLLNKETELIEKEIESFFIHVEDLLLHIEILVLSEPDDLFLKSYLQGVLDYHDDLASIYFYTADHRMINPTGFELPAGVTLEERDWYILSLQQPSQVIYTSSRLNLTEDRQIVTMAKSVFLNNELIGIIAADLDIYDISAYAVQRDIGLNGYAFLIDSAGMIVAHPTLINDDLSLKSYEEISTGFNPFNQSNDLIRIRLEDDWGMLSSKTILNDQYYLGVFLPMDEFRMVAQQQMIYLIGGLIFIFTLISSYIFLYTKGFVEPFRNLALDIESIDIQKNPKYRLNLDRKLGFSKIRKAINHLLYDANRYFETVQNQVDKLEYMANYDTLTSVKNRLAYENTLTQLEMTQTVYFALMMADINNLKMINDSFGHLVGDQVIKKVASQLKKTFEGHDIFRIGGDEFVVIIKNVTHEQTELIKKEAIEAFKDMAFHQIDITVSFGYEVKVHIQQNIKDIQRNAENYMYRTKVMSRMTGKSKQIDTIMKTLYEKSKREEAHSKRVSEWCQMLASKLNLSDERVNEIKIAGLLHDIGKIAVDEHILNKPGKLLEHEWIAIKRHPEVGFNILNTVDEFKQISLWILAHHERIDGQGYPRGLKGDEIPLESKIISIVDAYDAMTKDRTYRKPLTKEQAICELEKGIGTQFDKKLVHLFITLLEEYEK